MRKKWERCLRASPLFFVLCFSYATAQTTVDRTVTASGSVVATNSAFQVTGTLGQPIIGMATTLNNNLAQGFWYGDQNSTISSIEAPTTGEQLIQLHCSPNPISRTATLHLYIPRTGKTTLRMTDLLGRTVRTIIDEPSKAGEREIQVDVQELSNGRYTLHLQTESEHTSLPVHIVN